MMRVTVGYVDGSELVYCSTCWTTLASPNRVAVDALERPPYEDLAYDDPMNESECAECSRSVTWLTARYMLALGGDEAGNDGRDERSTDERGDDGRWF